MGEAVLGDGVACQVAGLLFLEGDAVAVGGDGVGADVSLGHVNGDEADVGVLLGSPGQGSAVQVADADDGVGAVVDGLTDHGLAVLIGSVGLAVVAHVVLDSGPAGLVEALVVDGAGIAAQSDVGDNALGGSLRRGGGGSGAGSSGRGGAGSGARRGAAAGSQNRNGSGCASHGHELTARNHIHKKFSPFLQLFATIFGQTRMRGHSGAFSILQYSRKMCQAQAG